jgi:hypothetical protein
MKPVWRADLFGNGVAARIGTAAQKNNSRRKRSDPKIQNHFDIFSTNSPKRYTLSDTLAAMGGRTRKFLCRRTKLWWQKCRLATADAAGADSRLWEWFDMSRDKSN